VGMPPMIAIAQQIKDKDYQPFTILGSEVPFPFDEKPADNAKNYAGATHTMPLLEDWGVELSNGNHRWHTHAAANE
jgi:dihydroorotate dehydrogenase electron transfer subunit